MGLFVDERKVSAAAYSMHQFCQVVRTVFPGEPEDAAVESATLYLYMQIARDVFGKRFAMRLGSKLRDQLKYTTPAEAVERVGRIGRQAEALERTAGSMGAGRSFGAKCRTHVTSVIEALLSEAGFRSCDPELIKDTYGKFEEVVRTIKGHLVGIKRQNHFLMKTKSRV